MKIKDAMPIYREYRQRLVNQTRDLVKQRDTAIAKLEATGDVAWSKEAATLELSIEATKKDIVVIRRLSISMKVIVRVNADDMYFIQSLTVICLLFINITYK